MTVPVNAVKKIIQCDGQTRTWQFNYPLLSGETMEVWVKPPQGALYRADDHVVIDRESNENYTYVTYPALSSGLEPLGSGYKILLCRATPLTQEIIFSSHVRPQTLTEALDKTVLQIQNLDEKISRCVRFLPDPSLPSEATDADSFLGNILTQAQQTIQTAAADVTSSLSAHNASATAHADLRQALTQAQSTLSAAVSSEQTARQQGDTTLQTGLTGLTAALADETSARESADTSLQTQLTSQAAAIGALETGVAGKQGALSAVQLTAVNSGVTSDTVEQVQTNKEDIAALETELAQSRPWEKPADWVDIRNGAQENSVYFLVGHSADYSKYAKFAFKAEPSSHTTYDVFIDGIKIVSAASNWATTTIDFQTLNLSSGWDTTYPEALRTHIVRVAPTDTADTLTRIQTQSVSGQIEQGVLWAHFQLSNAIGIDSLFGSESSRRFSLLEALTAKDNKITYTVGSTGTTSGLYQSFAYCTALTQLPVLEAQNTTYGSGGYISFLNVPAKKIVIKNNKGTESFAMFNQCKAQEIEVENGLTFGASTTTYGDFHNLTNLTKLPTVSTGGQNFQAYGFSHLGDTIIDDSGNANRKLFRFYGTSGWPTRALKGLTVSSAAPFDGASPQIKVDYTGMNRAALVHLFRSLPTVTDCQVCSITGATGAGDLTAEDLSIATEKGWTITR